MMELFTKKLNNRKGFTLIELIVVIAIIGILAAILIPQFGGFTDKAKSTAALVDAKQVATAFDSWMQEYASKVNNLTTQELTAAKAATGVEKLSGVKKAGTITVVTIEADGGVIVTDNGFTASRATGTDPVKLN